VSEECSEERARPAAIDSFVSEERAGGFLIDDLALAAELVHEAGVLATTMLSAGLDTHHKTSISDVVSAADHAAERLVLDRLRQARPDDGVIGEEGANHPGKRTWFIDPVDGTYNFLFGLPYWCSALALAHRPDPAGPLVPVLGAVYHPFADELWLGGQDAPTTCNGKPVAPLLDTPLERLSLASYLHPTMLPDDDAREPFLTVMAGAATVRMLGSGSIELASVAAGQLGVWAHLDCLDWDWLPGAALVTAAGGVTEVIHHRGHRWHLAGNRQAVSEIRQLLLG
jgi:myo-inositol-1(or 4)-monophosphatase